MTTPPRARGHEGGAPFVDAFAVFRPRWARLVAGVLSVVVLVGLGALFVFVRPNAATRLGTEDYVLMLVFTAILLGILWRQASVQAVPDPEGLSVRNLARSRRVAWSEVVSVRFSGDRPWAQLDLSDGEALAVMAVQSADGERARAEARRLAALVARYGTARRPH